MTDTSGFASETETATLTSGFHSGRLDRLDQMTMLQWHLERYDRLRSSTANRAAVVLSAGALLLTADAVITSQFLGASSSRVPLLAVIVCTAIAVISSALVVQSVVRASGVLVTPKDSRSLLTATDHLPLSLIFNGTDTVTHLRSFDDFATHLETLSDADKCRAAQVELWICIHQHRYRYTHLRDSVRSLRYASGFFLAALIGVTIVDLLCRL